MGTQNDQSGSHAIDFLEDLPDRVAASGRAAHQERRRIDPCIPAVDFDLCQRMVVAAHFPGNSLPRNIRTHLAALVFSIGGCDMHLNEFCFECAGQVGGSLHYRVGHV